MPAVNSLAFAVHHCGVVQLNRCLKPCRRTHGQTIFTSGRWAVPHVNLESCRMAQILCPDTPQPWLEAFSLRAGSRAEERGLAIDWFSSLALACIPRFRRPGSSHWLRGHAGHSSIFFETSSVFCCLCHGLSQLRTHYFLLFSFTLEKEINVIIMFTAWRVITQCSAVTEKYVDIHQGALKWILNECDPWSFSKVVFCFYIYTYIINCCLKMVTSWHL